jgi:putative ABC transport system permease protein
MSLGSRVLRNATRSRARTIGVAFAVGIALSAFLIFSQINAGVGQNAANARAALKDLITITTAGSSGFGFSGSVSQSIVPKVAATPGVESVQRILIERTGGNFSGGGGGGPGSFANFTVYQGVDTTSTVSSFGGFGGATGLTIVAGRTLDSADENRSVAIVGQTYANNHNEVPGSTVDINGTGMQVVGIFSTGTQFGDNNIILPYPAARVAFSAAGPTLLSVTINGTASLDGVLGELRGTVGSSYDVSAPSQSTGGAFGTAISSILSSTQFESYAALGVGAAIMVVVTAIVTAQRTKEIGLLKAFGFSNGRIVSQLFLEGLLLSAFGLPIAFLATLGLGPTVAQYVAGQALSSSTGGRGGFFGNFAGRLVSTVSFGITPALLLLAIGVTFAFGVVGSLYPILRAIRLRPAEAVRHE